MNKHWGGLKTNWTAKPKGWWLGAQNLVGGQLYTPVVNTGSNLSTLMIWMMGQRGLSGSWTTQKEEEWLMHQRVLLLSRGTCTGWRNGLMGTCAVQWGKFTGGGTSPCPRMPSREAAWLAEKANTLLGCVRGPCPSAQHSGLSWAPQVERHRPTEEDSAMNHKAGKELEHLSHEASLTMGTGEGCGVSLLGDIWKPGHVLGKIVWVAMPKHHKTSRALSNFSHSVPFCISIFS